MTNRLQVLSAVCGLSMLVGCGAVANTGRDASAHGDGAGADGSIAAPGDTLPCAVANVLTTYCAACHATGTHAAPMALANIADLTRPSLNTPSISMAQSCVNRMRDTTTPMPPSPSPAVAAADIAAFEAWVTAGMMPSSCSTLPPADPLDADPTCTTMTNWARGNRGSVNMRPGAACIACHSSSGEGPGFWIAGTVYPTGHEPDNCNGQTSTTADPVEIEITDANAVVYHLFSNAFGNSAGNFFLQDVAAQNFATPYTARVLYQGRERRMVAPQTDGDCNTCHTNTGANGAPGRVTVPGPAA